MITLLPHFGAPDERRIGRATEVRLIEPRRPLGPPLVADHAPVAPLPTADWRRILVVRLDNRGDVVLLGPSLRALRAAAPAATITLLASPAGAEAAPLLPWLDEVVVHRASWQATTAASRPPDADAALIARLARGAFDVAFVFTSFSQTAFPAAEVALLAGIPLRVGFARDFGGVVLTHPVTPPADGTHQADRNLALLAGVGVRVADPSLHVALTADHRVAATRRLDEAGIPSDAPYLVLAPAASCSARQYPGEHFAEVARDLAARSRREVVVVGGPADVDLAAAIAHGVTSAGHRAASLAGRTTMPELAAVIANAELLVTSHSLPVHLADALGVPAVVLFSGTDDEREWAARDSRSTVLRVATDCAPCRRFTCPIGLPCLDIPPATVVDAALELLAERAVGEPAGALVESA